MLYLYKFWKLDEDIYLSKSKGIRLCNAEINSETKKLKEKFDSTWRGVPFEESALQSLVKIDFPNPNWTEDWISHARLSQEQFKALKERKDEIKHFLNFIFFSLPSQWWNMTRPALLPYDVLDTTELHTEQIENLQFNEMLTTWLNGETGAEVDNEILKKALKERCSLYDLHYSEGQWKDINHGSIGEYLEYYKTSRSTEIKYGILTWILESILVSDWGDIWKEMGAKSPIIIERIMLRQDEWYKGEEERKLKHKISRIDKKEVRLMYNIRSKIVHGRKDKAYEACNELGKHLGLKWDSSMEETSKLNFALSRLEQTTSAILWICITEPDFLIFIRNTITF